MKKSKTFQIIGKNSVATYRTDSRTGFMYLVFNLLILPITFPLCLAIKTVEIIDKKRWKDDKI